MHTRFGVRRTADGRLSQAPFGRLEARPSDGTRGWYRRFGQVVVRPQQSSYGCGIPARGKTALRFP